MGLKHIKILKWGGWLILVAFVLLVIVRMFVLDAKEKTEIEVAKIHATKLTLDDVMGKNLPVAFAGDASASQAYYDSTVQGVDVNKNGIRDDVEIAIFREYPNSAKTRAVLLQYALALQMEVTQEIVNTEIFTAIIEDNETRALNCIWSITSRADKKNFTKVTSENEDFVKLRQFNTAQRTEVLDRLYEDYLGSYSASQGGCDLDLSSFPN